MIDDGALESLQEPVDYRVDERGAASITLNRPHRLNAINAALVDGLVAALRQAAEDEVRVVVLAGAGTSFCAGHDLREPQGGYTRERADGLQEVTRLMRALPAVVVAAVRGYAVGGGAEFALGADLVVATESARFTFPEVSVGLSATGGSTALVPRLVGLAQAKRLMLLGEPLDGVEAKRIGLIAWAVPDSELEATLDSLVDRLVGQGRTALALAKRALDVGLDNDFEAQLQLEIDHVVTASATDEAAAAAERFTRRQAT